MFDRSSGLVQVWVHLIRQKAYALSQVPNLSNLREAVASALEGGDKV